MGTTIIIPIMSIVLIAVLIRLIKHPGIAFLNTGEVGIKVRLGIVQNEILHEGIHFYNPLLFSVYSFDTRKSIENFYVIAITKDSQRIEVDLSIFFNIDRNNVQKLFKEINITHYRIYKDIITPILIDLIKDEMGLFSADEIIKNRDDIAGLILKKAKKKLKTKFIILSNIEITSIGFDNEYARAIIEKTIALQDANKAKEESKRILEIAKAEARSIEIKTKALEKNKSLIALEAAKKWDGKLPVYIAGDSIPFIEMKELGNKLK